MFCGRCVNWIIHRKLKKFWRQLPKQKMVYKLFLLKASTPLVIVKGQSSQHIHKITNLWKSELNWWSKLQEINWRKKKTLSHKLCAFRCLDIETSVSWGLKIKYFSEKLPLSQKSMLLQREPFLTMFCILSTALHCSLPSKFLW